MASILDQTPRAALDTAALFQAAADEERQNLTATRANRVSTEGELDDDGNADTESRILEKHALVAPSDEDCEALIERMKLKLHEGRGECLYELGVAEHTGDAGITVPEMTASTATLHRLAGAIGASATCLRTKHLPAPHHAADADHPPLCTADFLVRHQFSEDDFMEVRCSVVGNVDAGKSTLLGVLTHAELDDGRGHARLKLFRHKHEVESGRTSSVGNDILGFDAEGKIVNHPDKHSGNLDWLKICQDGSKVITFIDLAGHEKYLKTTIFGMTGHEPNYSMLMIGANAGIVGMTKEHLGLALALSVPVFVVVTKIDMCPTPVLQETLKLLQKLLKSPGCRKLPVMVQSVEDVVVSATNFQSERICPIFQVSNVSGENLDLLKMFLNLLPIRSNAREEEPAEFQIDDTYWVDGVGAVVSGTCLKGIIRLNDNLLLGPMEHGQFKKKDIRKGMALVSPKLEPKACWEFEGEILVLHHPTTISPKYQAMVHCGPIRQTATILTMDMECLRTGDKAICRFRFFKNPEYLRLGNRMVFREGRTKAVGNITKVFTHAPTSASGAQQAAQQQRSKGAAATKFKSRAEKEHALQLNGVTASASSATGETATSSSAEQSIEASNSANVVPDMGSDLHSQRSIHHSDEPTSTSSGNRRARGGRKRNKAPSNSSPPSRPPADATPASAAANERLGGMQPPSIANERPGVLQPPSLAD